MDSKADLTLALQSFRENNLHEAIQRSLAILDYDPENADALQLAVVIACQLGSFEEAIAFSERFLQIRPGDAEAHYNMGNALHGKGDYAGAIRSYRASIDLNPDNVAVYNNLGAVYQSAGSLEEAVACCQKALELNPKDEKALNNLGNAFKQQDNLNGAIRCFEKALALNPDNVHIRINLANVLRDKGELNRAIACYREALEAYPHDADLLYSLGNACKETGDFHQAVFFYERSLSANPGFVDAWYNLGNTWRELGRYDDSISCYESTLKLRPDYFEAFNNLGVAYKEKGDTRKAIAHYDRALAINPSIAETQWNKALAQLLGGDFEEGWKGYEWRWKKQDYEQYHRDFSQPLWDGSDIRGKTILLHAEQGYGDAIQFVRYISMIRERGANVILECQKSLVALFHCIEGVDRIVAKGDAIPEFHVHCPLLSLPRVFQTVLSTIPSVKAYLKAPDDRMEKWRRIIGKRECMLNIGLVWAGNPEHKNDRNRSCTLEDLSLLAGMPGVSYYSLQIKGKGGGREEEEPAWMGLIDYTEEIQDFADTAAIIMQLDLVISVDTVIAHLAGALGRPVWTMLPFAPDWRWLLNRDSSPWYPSMRLFRQASPGDWKAVVRRTKKCLHGLLDLHNG